MANNPSMILLLCIYHLLLFIFCPHPYKLGNKRINREVTAFLQVFVTF